MPQPRRLILLRHAQAQAEREAAADHERPLTAGGKADATQVARQLKEAGIRPSLILYSSALRTTQTARIVAAVLGYPGEFLQREAALYLASADTLLDVLAGQDASFHDILICGHNPGLSDLAVRLLDPPPAGLVPAAALVIETLAEDWSSLRHGSLQQRCLPPA